jgi:hypothetical protein
MSSNLLSPGWIPSSPLLIYSGDMNIN